MLTVIHPYQYIEHDYRHRDSSCWHRFFWHSVILWVFIRTYRMSIADSNNWQNFLNNNWTPISQNKCLTIFIYNFKKVTFHAKANKTIQKQRQTSPISINELAKHKYLQNWDTCIKSYSWKKLHYVRINACWPRSKKQNQAIVRKIERNYVII